VNIVRRLVSAVGASWSTGSPLVEPGPKSAKYLKQFPGGLVFGFRTCDTKLCIATSALLGRILLSAIYSSQMRCRCWIRCTSSRAVFENRARCHLLPAAGFFTIGAAPRLGKANGSNLQALLALPGLKNDLLTL
jgi:hypothetical protein